MHKLIKKYETPTATGLIKDVDYVTNWFGNSFKKSDYGDNLSKAKGASTIGNIAGVASMVTPMVDPAIQLLGGKEADNISGGEQLFSKGTDMAFDLAMKTGNPWLMGGAALLKGADWLNRYGGKENKKQGTVGLNTGAYAFNLNPNAGQKQTLLGTWTGNVKNADKLTNYYDKMNLLGGNAAYSNKQNLLAASNSVQDVATKNRQSILGGINTNILAAKTGAKLNPAELRNLTKKAKRGIKIEVVKFEEGGKIMNVIPEGALHARKHSLPEELSDKITDKGIPVITYDEGGEITQHAEIELNEIIFNKETTVTLEDYFKQYNEVESQEEKNKIAIECGKFLTSEILENTDDRTGLLNTIE